MRILTLVRAVPDSRSTVKPTPDGLGIETPGLKSVCDPFDEFAIEEALQLRDNRTDVPEIVAITIGPPDAEVALRAALAMGADRGIHITRDDIVMHDEVYLAEILAACIKNLDPGFDLILTGKQSTDNDAGEIGPALAEFLGIEHIGAVAELKIADDASSVNAKRRIEGAEEIVEARLPLLITCDKGLVEPRLPALPNIIKAKKKPVEKLSAADIANDAAPRTEFIKLSPPPDRRPCEMIVGEPQHMARELVRLLRDEAKVV